ncbi:MAG: leucyl aminopeptidase [Xanthobacteraceae bacterium]|nr:leucyl aminopeptidase [Xanthobacteraceae bacterium]
MAISPKIVITDLKTPVNGTLVVLTDEDLAIGAAAKAALKPSGDLFQRVAKIEHFKGKRNKVLDLAAPSGLKLEHLVVAGIGKAKEMKAEDWLKLGGSIMGKLPAGVRNATVLAEIAAGKLSAEDAAQIALGMKLRAYKFDRYKTKKKDDDDEPKPAAAEIRIAVADATAAKKAWAAADGVGDGIVLARELVNEPPNVLFPAEFARRASELKKLGVQIEVLDEPMMKKLGMNALLAVGQGSERDSRLVIMRWNGAKKKAETPIAIVGKGVCFDTGGISIKPAASMEDMKGDMAGAACVTGLMHALASRKARANVIGVIGIVENMPDGNSYRPGDILKSYSGQTIEVINTDAEGRLVLCDALAYTNQRFKPKLIIDLATLTGAILIALGQEYAGLFSNDDKLAERLTEAGKVTGELVWRMPLAPYYDKMIDSKFADMKNTGGRFGGSITAAQFLQRYIGKTPWAHLDIAGTGMAAHNTEIGDSWGPGWGVRLLNEFIAAYCEK